MNYRISKHELELLKQNSILIEDGLLSSNKNIIAESGMPIYIVSLWVASYNAEIRIGTHGGSGIAMAIARKLFPHGRIYSAKSA